MYGCTSYNSSSPTNTNVTINTQLEQDFQRLEQSVNGRLGVYILDTQTNTTWLYNHESRFRMMSTFKALACGMVLARVETSDENLDRMLTIEQEDIIANSWNPYTAKHVGEQISMKKLCDVVMAQSDNSAANMVLTSLGGPNQLTTYLRSIGDDRTRLDRLEPKLNYADGDKDTTTPQAIAETINKFVLGDELSDPRHKNIMINWLKSNKYSSNQLRAGIPSHWEVGDRTGAASDGSKGIVSIIWPPHRSPIIAAIYVTDVTHPGATEEEIKTVKLKIDKLFADVGTLIVEQIISENKDN